MQPALLEQLGQCERVLLVGAGGGYDVYCGLPLFHWLKARGKTAFLASLSFRGGPLEEVLSPGSQPEECLSPGDTPLRSRWRPGDPGPL